MGLLSVFASKTAPPDVRLSLRELDSMQRVEGPTLTRTYPKHDSTESGHSYLSLTLIKNEDDLWDLVETYRTDQVEEPSITTHKKNVSLAEGVLALSIRSKEIEPRGFLKGAFSGNEFSMPKGYNSLPAIERMLKTVPYDILAKSLKLKKHEFAPDC